MGVAQVTECLPNNSKALGLSPLYASAQQLTIRLSGAYW